jgi:hypothetical protein
MMKLKIILAAAFFPLALAVSAQDTNSLKTSLGVFENQTGMIIVKGYNFVGSISVGTDTISVLCKESTDTSRGQRADGVAIEIAGTPPFREKILIDYDEIDSLLGSIDYLNKITQNVTPLLGFEASYSTKAGLRVIADSVRRDGGIKTSVAYGDHPKILLSSVQLMQLYALIGQAKNTLDSIRSEK